MKTLSYRTESAKKHEIDRKWHIVDAEGMVVGRMCSTIAAVLRGKHKAQYTPHVDTGDYVIVINADKVKFTGKKWDDKVYLRYSGYTGGQKKRTAKQAVAKKPFFIVENAVRGMLPKNSLGRQMFRKLFVYAGTDHPHGAQKPEELKVIS